MSNQNDKLKRLLDIQRELDVRKALYAEYDKIVLELVQEKFIRAAVDGFVLELKDNFLESNTGWTRSAVKRYEVEVITEELAEKRKRKAVK